MRTARRYLASEIYRASAVVLVALLGLFTFFTLIEELDSVGAELTLLNLFYLQVLQMPTRLYDLLPIGLLIGAILALAGLAQRNELVILRVSGVSGFRLLFSLWLLTVPAVFGAFALSEYLTPAAELKTSEVKLNLFGQADGGRLASGYWFKETDCQGGTRIINISTLQASGNVADIVLYEFRAGQELATFSRAKRGRFADGRLILSDIEETTIAAASVDALADARTPDAPITTLRTLETRELASSLTPERLIARVLTPERMSMFDLLDYIDYLQTNNLETERQVIAFWRKLAYPFTLFVMITIAAPISFMQTRRGGVGSKVFIGILLGVGFFMLNQLALNLGMLSRWPPWVTALVPSLGALAIALTSLLAMEYRHRLQQFNRSRSPWTQSAP